MKQKWYIVVTLILLLSCIACAVTFSREETPPCDITSLILEQEIMLEGGESDLGYVFLLEQDSLGAQRAYNIHVNKPNISRADLLSAAHMSGSKPDLQRDHD